MSELSEGRAVSKEVGEADDSGTWICEGLKRALRSMEVHTHCDNRPPCEIVKRILSAKYRQETSVWMPPTKPAVALLLTGNGDASIPPLTRRPLRADIAELVILSREDVVYEVGVHGRG